MVDDDDISVKTLVVQLLMLFFWLLLG